MYPEEALKLREIDCSGEPGAQVPGWVKDMILYEVYVRNYSVRGTFQGLIDNLDHIQSLGANAIWLMPVHPIGKEGRKGASGCPYAIYDYFKINSEYGDEENFRDLVNEVHNRGMKIIIDMVANHASVDNINMEFHPDWFMFDIKGRPTRRVSDWTDVVDHNYDVPELWEYMKAVLRYWVEEFDIDGYRCDVAGMVPVEFWEEAFSELREIKEELFFLAEWCDSPALCVNAFNSDYRDEVYLEMLEIYRGKNPASNLIEKWLYVRELRPRSYFPLNFIENHDIKRVVSIFGISGFRPFATFIFTIPGIPLVYNGQEMGISNYMSLFERNPFESVEYIEPDQDVYQHYVNLVEFRKSHPASRNGKVIPIKTDRDEYACAYAVVSDEEAYLCILNLSHSSGMIRVNFDPLEHFTPGEYIFPPEKAGKRKADYYGGKLEVFVEETKSAIIKLQRK